MKQWWMVMIGALCLACIPGTYSVLWSQDQKIDPGAEQQIIPTSITGDTKNEVTGNISFGIFSTYLSRGYELSRHSVVIQPSMTISYRGLSLIYWGNIDSKEHHTQAFKPDRDEKRSFNESDVTVSYTRNIGKMSLTGGWAYYATKYADETKEVFATISFNIMSKPSITLYRDIDRFPGTYFNVSFSHSLPLWGDLTLDLGASAAYMWGSGAYWKTFDTTTGDYKGPKYQALHDGMVKVGLTMPITKRVSLIPVIQYWFPLSDKASKHWGTDSYNPSGYIKSYFVGGINISYSL